MNSSSHITSHDDGQSLSESNGCLGSVDFVTLRIFVEIADEGSEIVSLQVPNLDSTVVCNTSKDRGGLRTPADIVDLSSKLVLILDSRSSLSLGLTLVSTNELLGSASSPGFPDSDSPIVRASQENRVIDIIPERIATHFINGSSVSMVHFHILFSVRSLALQDSTILSGSEVVHALAFREINRQTTCVNERHSTILLLHISSSIYILMVGVGLAFQLV